MARGADGGWVDLGWGGRGTQESNESLFGVGWGMVQNFGLLVGWLVFEGVILIFFRLVDVCDGEL